MPRTIQQTSTAKPSIIIDHVSKRFRKRNTHSMKEAFLAAIRGRKVRSESFTALDDVSFQIGEGESVAVMGMNGSGKSTTLKMVSGVLEPDEGRVFTRGRVAGLIEVGAGFHPELTGRDNVYLNAAILGMSKEQTDARFDDIIEFSEIGEFIDQAVKHYSSGMFMRLAFAVAIHVDADVLLVDEVLSVGDAPFRRKCNAKLKELAERGVTMMIVSHNRNIVSKLCTRGIIIRDHKVAFDGPILEAVEQLEENEQTRRPARGQQRKPARRKPAQEKPAEEKRDAPEEAADEPAIESIPDELKGTRTGRIPTSGFTDDDAGPASPPPAKGNETGRSDPPA